MSTDQFENAKLRMERRFLDGVKQEEALLASVAQTVIVDRLVPPRQMTFISQSDGSIVLRYRTAEGTRSSDDTDVMIHRHALNQLCAKCGYAMNQFNFLAPKSTEENSGWGMNLNVYALNKMFHCPEWAERGGAPTRFLHRIVGKELRGFLSQRYARHLASAPLLRAFVDACCDKEARPIEATNSAVRMSLKCLLPHVFEAFPGEYICLGVEFGNSDFGAGRLTVRSTIWRVSMSTSAVLDETFSKVHIGSVIEESDLAISEATWHKETEAQKGVIVDVVGQLLSAGTVDRLLQALRVARDENIPWSKLRSRLAGLVGKGDLDWMQQAADNGAGIVDLPPISFTPDGERIPNAYWASAAVSAIASRSEDMDRRMELQKEAGKLLVEALRG
jgi:hypothetical protein